MARSVISIGNFDGVHAGHAALLGRARALATGHAARVLALTFDPHPATVLRPGQQPDRLCTLARRVELLRAAGADEVAVLAPTPELLGKRPEAFVDQLVSAHAPVAFVEGADFRFGKGRSGDLNLLATLGRARGFVVEAVPPVSAVLGDQSIVPCSSTMARWLIAHGRVLDAWSVLGRPFEIAGLVVRGDRRGRTIGMPTANIAHEAMLPADGVYAGVAHLPGGRAMAAAVSVGTKPTFSEAPARTAEAFLMPIDAEHAPTIGAAASAWRPLPGLDEYGWPLRIELVGWVREQARFADVASLCEQMWRDVARVLRIVRDRTNPERAA